MLDVMKRSLDDAMSLLGARGQDNDPEAILVGESFEYRVDPDLAVDMPAHGGHIVIGHGMRHAFQFSEGALVEEDDTFYGFIWKVLREKPAAKAKGD